MKERKTIRRKKERQKDDTRKEEIRLKKERKSEYFPFIANQRYSSHNVPNSVLVSSIEYFITFVLTKTNYKQSFSEKPL